MNERKQNILVGLTAMIALGGFLLMLSLFGALSTWLHPGYDVRAEFANASGLNVGSRVKLSGIDVGQVSNIDLLEPPKRGVVVTMHIDPKVKLPVGVHAMIEAPLLGGTPSIGLEMPVLSPNAVIAWLPTDGSAVVRGESATMASQLAAELQNALQEPMQKFDTLSVEFKKLADEWTKVGRNVNALIEPHTVDEVDAGKAPGNIATTVQRIDQRLKELQGVLEGLGKWVNDAELYANVRKTVENTAQITGKVNAGVEKFTQLADSSRESVEKLAKRYVAVADDLSATVGTLQKTIEQARAGQGTVGKFLNDPALYNNLNDAVQRMNQAMTEVRLLVEKWKKEGLPVQF